MDKTTSAVGAIDPDCRQFPDISGLLKTPPSKLHHGEEFTGKPVTRIHISDDAVLKINTSGAFDNRDIATAWCQRVLSKERKAGIFHPERTWLVLFEENSWRTANITPRLVPLHIHIKQCDATQSLDWLLKVTEMYLNHAAKFNERLDEGLSNFGVDAEGTLYYLDDDLYSWDHFLSFSAMIAGWFRQFSDSWMDNDLAKWFGKSLASQLRQSFAGIHGIDPLHIVYEHLRTQYLNEDAQQRCQIVRDILIRSRSSKVRKEADMVDPAFNPKSVRIDASEWFSQSEPIGIIADVHANRPALLRVLEELERQNVNRILCLGDIVGYGPHPADCIDILIESGVLCLRGNHDHMVGNGAPVPSMHGDGLLAAQWTIGHLDQQRRNWLLTLPLQIRYSPWMAVHGAPQDPTFFNAYIYDRTADSNLDWMKQNGFDFCLHGHSHLQGCFTLKGDHAVRQFGTIDVSLKGPVLICPGSVGQPRSGYSEAEYAILYPDTHRLVTMRCGYDIETTINDMKSAKLPDKLAQRLLDGR